MHPKMIKKKRGFYEKNAPLARSFYATKYAAGKTYRTKCAVDQNF